MYYMECDENIEFFLGSGSQPYAADQWFEVWVELVTPEGIVGLIVRGASYGHLRFNEETTKIGQFMWNVDGQTWGTPSVGDAVRSLFD